MKICLKANGNNFILYFLLIPFLYPKGMGVYFPEYKIFFTSWLYVSLVVIYLLIFYEVLKMKLLSTKYIYVVLMYFVIMFVLTLTIRHTFVDGLQKIFATPALCLLSGLYLKRTPVRYIVVMNNILRILFFLNITFFSPLFWSQFAPISNHLTFLGHVQIGAQLGTVGVFFAYLEYILCNQPKRKFITQVVLSIITMLTSFTSAAYISIILLILFWILDKLKIKKIFVFKGQTYLIYYLVLNVILFMVILSGRISFEFLGFSLNGRGFIWKEALNSFFASPIYGYGVQGVLIKVFWSVWVEDGAGMNYMHNQILQVLNDGGLLLLVPYILMLYYSVKSLNQIEKHRVKFWITICTIIMLINLTFESSFEYFYAFLMFTAIAYLPLVLKNNDSMMTEVERDE